MSPPPSAATELPTLTLLPVVPFAGVYEVTNLVSSRDGSRRLFLTRQVGSIHIWDGTQVRASPFLDLTGVVRYATWEDGLLGLVFHPQFATNGFFFVNYTNASGELVVARYRVSAADPNRADPTSAQIVLTTPHGGDVHYGGQLQFGPDGYLYIGIGDAGSTPDASNPAQSLGSRLGKLLRIDVNQAAPYAIPPTNPFVGVPAALPEIWALGFRNPWRFSFDRQTGDLLIADLGQDSWEEVDLQPASTPGGRNFGWPRMEGAHCFSPAVGCNDGSLTLPLWEYAHAAQGCTSITGGYVYRGAAIPALRGTYLYADYCQGIVTALELGPPPTPLPLFAFPQNNGFVSSFGEDELGELHVVDYFSGRTYEVVPGRDVSVAASGPEVALAGTVFRHTITAVSTIASRPGSVTMTETLPSGLSVASASGCTVAAGGVTCEMGIGLGGTYTREIWLRASPATTGMFTTIVKVVSDAPDPRPLDNQVSLDVTVLPAPLPDLTISLSDDRDPMASGGVLRYDLTARNRGPALATQVNVALMLPLGATVLSIPAPCQLESGRVNCAFQYLNVDQSVDLSVLVTTPRTYGTLVAKAAVGASQKDPYLSNNIAIEATTLEFVKGDFNGDLTADLVLHHVLTGGNEFWYMRGNQRLGAAPVVPAVPVALQVVGTDDFNADQLNDLVMRNVGTGAVEFWLMKNAERIGTPVPLSGATVPTLEWRLVATGDFTGDQQPDLLWHNTRTRGLLIWSMNGTAFGALLTPQPAQSVDPNWEVVAAADYNSDGWRDLLWYNSVSGKVVQWLLDGSAARVAGRFTSPASAGSSAWQVVSGGEFGPAAGAVPALGLPTIVWRNGSTGKLVMWFLDESGQRVDGRFTVPDAPDDALNTRVVGPR